MNIQVDHVHVLTEINPNISISKAVLWLKSGSSKVIKSEFSKLEESLWENSFCTDGYFVEICGQLNIKEYIKNR